MFYDFTSTPFKATATYTTTSKTNFNIEWLVSGGDYVTTLRNDTTTSAKQISMVATNETLGNLPSVMLGHSHTHPTYNVKVDVSDAGTADFAYGQIRSDNQSYNAVAAVFAKNVARIDPSLSQDNDCATGSVNMYPSMSCSFTSNITAGDVLVVGSAYENLWPQQTMTISDSKSNSWTQSNLAYNGNSELSEIWYAKASASGSDTITVANSTDYETVTNGFLYIMEVSGMVGDLVESSETATGSCSAGTCAGINIATSSDSFSHYDFAFGLGNPVGIAIASATESGYTMVQLGYQPTAIMYSTSGVSSPTAFTFKTCTGWCYGGQAGSWVDEGVLFLSVKQPISATLNTVYGGSTQTVSVPGCSSSPSTFAGDGSSNNIVMSANCSFSLSIPSGYQWTTSSSGTSCSSGTCGTTFSATYERSPVTQPITATFKAPIGTGGGTNQNVTASGCGVSPATFPGNGAAQSLTVAPSCELTIALPTGYAWNNTGRTLTGMTCSGTCYDQSFWYALHSSNFNSYIGMPSNECVVEENPGVDIQFNATMTTSFTGGNAWSAQLQAVPISYASGHNTAHKLDWMQFSINVNTSNRAVFGEVTIFNRTGALNTALLPKFATVSSHIQNGDKFTIQLFQNNTNGLGVTAVWFTYTNSTGSVTQTYAMPSNYQVPVVAWQLEIVGLSHFTNTNANFTSGGANITYYSLVNSNMWQTLQPHCDQAYNDSPPTTPFTGEFSNMIYGTPSTVPVTWGNEIAEGVER